MAKNEQIIKLNSKRIFTLPAFVLLDLTHNIYFRRGAKDPDTFRMFDINACKGLRNWLEGLNNGKQISTNQLYEINRVFFSKIRDSKCVNNKLVFPFETPYNEFLCEQSESEAGLKVYKLTPLR